MTIHETELESKAVEDGSRVELTIGGDELLALELVWQPPRAQAHLDSLAGPECQS
jgi:hypothetical protein